MAMSAARILTFEVMTSKRKSTTGDFDRREMLIVHDVFRREFALMPITSDICPNLAFLVFPVPRSPSCEQPGRPLSECPYDVVRFTR